MIPGLLPDPFDSLLGQPAVASVPAAFLTMIAVSLLTRSTVSPTADAVLAQLHLPGAVKRAMTPASEH